MTFSFPNSPDSFGGPPNLLALWMTEALSPWAKRLPPEAGHLPPTNAEVKDEWNYTSAPPACPRVVRGDKFTVCL